jgi:5-methyltetrahydrofolate--homocysteine methyltransferase
MRTTLQELLASANSSPVIADGGMGTMLFSIGLANGESPELWNVTNPDKIASIHRGYIEAGAQIILTNTFGCNRFRLELHKLQDRAAELNKAAAQIAVAEAEAADHSVVVAGDIGPSGGILKPLGEMEYEEAIAAFEEQARALVEGGVDVLWIETMSDLKEVQAAAEGCRRAAPDMPLVATMTFDTHGHTMMGVSPEKALAGLLQLDLVALGGNCGNGTAEIETVIKKMRAVNQDVILVAKSNAGMPRLEGGRAVYDATPDDLAEYAVTVRQLGANIIGACCGSTPTHIQAISAALRKSVPAA